MGNTMYWRTVVLAYYRTCAEDVLTDLVTCECRLLTITAGLRHQILLLYLVQICNYVESVKTSHVFRSALI